MRLIIIGGGPGGYETAVKAAERGLEVTLVSAGPLGGTCLNEGCIPTKALRRSADVADLVAESASFGIDATPAGVDFEAVMARKEQVVSELRGGIEFLLKKAKVTVLQGSASFIDAKTVRVELADGGETEVAADAIIVATGSVSASLPIPGADLCIDSAQLLSLPERPARLCVIGAGVIGLEFASIFRSFGSEVTVLEYCKEILPRFDTDLSKRLKQSLSRKGISIETSAGVQRVEALPDGGAFQLLFHEAA